MAEGLSLPGLVMMGAGALLQYSAIQDPAGGPIGALKAILQGRLPTPGTQIQTQASGKMGGGGSGKFSGEATGGTGNMSPGGSYSLPGVLPHVQAVANEVGPSFGIRTIGGLRLSGTGDHPRGLALDWMTTTGDALAQHLVDNYVRFKITYVIWNRRIWSASRRSEGWRLYTGTSNPHTDHVHSSHAP